MIDEVANYKVTSTLEVKVDFKRSMSRILVTWHPGAVLPKHIWVMTTDQACSFGVGYIASTIS